MNPLDQLADIRLPEDPSVWPLALGYWLVAGLIILIIASTIILIRKRQKRLACRNESLQVLNSIADNDSRAYQQIHHVLKTATAQYAKQQSELDVLQVHGDKWQQMLQTLYCGREKEKVCSPLCALSKWQYDERVDIAPTKVLKVAAQAWIKAALPPKKGAFDV